MDLKRIDENKLPIKYILGIHKELPAFPDAYDILYTFINANIKRPSKNGKNFSKHALLKYYSEGNHQNAEEGLKRALQLGFIESINETKDKETYRILINPFI
jgi:hypothetical protein